MIEQLKEILALLESVRERDRKEEDVSGRVMPHLSHLELVAARMKLREIIWAQENAK